MDHYNMLKKKEIHMGVQGVSVCVCVGGGGMDY